MPIGYFFLNPLDCKKNQKVIYCQVCHPVGGSRFASARPRFPADVFAKGFFLASLSIGFEFVFYAA